MPDFEIGHAPALMPHIDRHDAQALGLDLAAHRWAERMRLADRRIAAAIGKAGEDKPVAVNIGADQEYRAADGIKPDEIGPTAKVVHMGFALVAPRVEVVAGATRLDDAMRMQDVAAARDQPGQEIRRVVDDIDVEPQHPILLVEAVEQEVVAGFGQNLAARQLKGLIPARHAWREVKVEMLLP